VTTPASPPARLLGVAAAALGALVLWAYWPTLAVMAGRWVNDPEYSHGYLVPAFAAVLLWLRRDKLAGAALRPDWRGLPLLLAGAALRLLGTVLYVDWLDAVSLLPTAAGLFVLFGGQPALRWCWPAVAFLVFMIPLPYRLERSLAQPLQRVATAGSVYAMQVVGLPAVAEGTTIKLSRGPIGVVAACSGLSMLLTFLALAVAVVLVIDRPALDKAVVLASAVPIAVLANVARITLTGVLQETVGPEVAMKVFHDWGGWLMMPLALGMLALVLWCLRRLLVVPPAERPLAVPLGVARGGPVPESRADRRNRSRPPHRAMP
jgi:exosortase